MQKLNARFVLISLLLSACLFCMVSYSYSGDLFTPEEYAEKIDYTNDFCVIVMDLCTGEDIFVRDPQSMLDKPMAMGSIIKPFTIIAKFRNNPVDIGETHYCDAYNENVRDEEKCWLLAGHGRLTLIPALAHSCNTYFYNFSKDIDFALYVSVLQDWGVIPGRSAFTRRFLNPVERSMALIGKMNIMHIRATDLISAYAKIFTQKDAPHLAVSAREAILDGMRMVYTVGTAKSSREKLFMPDYLPVYCKTGTGVYEDSDGVDIRRTNGFFIGVYDFRYMVYVGALETTGSHAASYIGLSVLNYFAVRDTNSVQYISEDIINDKL